MQTRRQSNYLAKNYEPNDSGDESDVPFIKKRKKVPEINNDSDDDESLYFKSDSEDLESSICSDNSDETTIDLKENFNCDKSRFIKSKYEKYKAFMYSDDDSGADYLDDMIDTILKPLITRGNKCDRKKQDELVSFICSNEFKIINTSPYESICECCQAKKTLSMILTNGKKNFAVGSFCGNVLIGANKLTNLLKSEKLRCSLHMQTTFGNLNDIISEKLSDFH